MGQSRGEGRKTENAGELKGKSYKGREIDWPYLKSPIGACLEARKAIRQKGEAQGGASKVAKNREK